MAATYDPNNNPVVDKEPLAKELALNLPEGTTIALDPPTSEKKPKSAMMQSLDDMLDDAEPPPQASMHVLTGAPTATERLFHTEEFPQSSRGFGERTIAPNTRPVKASSANNRAVSVVLPPSSKHWHDQRFTWERHLSRERAGVPPKLQSQSLRGVNIPQVCQDQMLKMQANLFSLVEENRSLAAMVERLQRTHATMAADLALAQAQGFQTNAELAAQQAAEQQRWTRSAAADAGYDERARGHHSARSARGSGRPSSMILRRHREEAEVLRKRLAEEAAAEAEQSRLAAMPQIGPPGTATGQTGAFVSEEGLEKTFATPRHQSWRRANQEEAAVHSFLEASREHDGGHLDGAPPQQGLQGSAPLQPAFAQAPPPPLYSGAVPGRDFPALAELNPLKRRDPLGDYGEPWDATASQESLGMAMTPAPPGARAPLASAPLDAAATRAPPHAPPTSRAASARARSDAPNGGAFSAGHGGQCAGRPATSSGAPRGPRTSLFLQYSPATAATHIGGPSGYYPPSPTSAYPPPPTAASAASAASPRAMAAMVGSESGSSVTAVPYRVPDRTKKKGILAAGVAPGSGGGGRGGVGLGVGSSLLGGGESSVAGGRASFGASPRSGHKHLARLLESSTSTIDEGGSVTVVGLPLGTWYADGGAAVASGLGLAVALELTFTCWGQMKRSLNATVFRDMCSARLQQAGLL